MKAYRHNRLMPPPPYTLGFSSSDHCCFTAYVGEWAIDFRTEETWRDNQELLAQGRLTENAQKRREFNRRPYYPDRRDIRRLLKEHVDKSLV